MKNILMLTILLAVSQARAEAKFILEYYKTGTPTPLQVIELRESEKQKSFVREFDQAQCKVSVGRSTKLVASYRKVEMELECKEEFINTKSSSTCHYSDLNAAPAQISEVRAKRKRKKEVVYEMGPVPEGVEVVAPVNKGKDRKMVSDVTPLWDKDGCQNLSGGLDGLAKPELETKKRCCFIETPKVMK